MSFPAIQWGRPRKGETKHTKKWKKVPAKASESQNAGEELEKLKQSVSVAAADSKEVGLQPITNFLSRFRLSSTDDLSSLDSSCVAMSPQKARTATRQGDQTSFTDSTSDVRDGDGPGLVQPQTRQRNLFFRANSYPTCGPVSNETPFLDSSPDHEHSGHMSYQTNVDTADATNVASRRSSSATLSVGTEEFYNPETLHSPQLSPVSHDFANASHYEHPNSVANEPCTVVKQEPPEIYSDHACRFHGNDMPKGVGSGLGLIGENVEIESRLLRDASGLTTSQVKTKDQPRKEHGDDVNWKSPLELLSSIAASRDASGVDIDRETVLAKLKFMLHQMDTNELTKTLTKLQTSDLSRFLQSPAAPIQHRNDEDIYLDDAQKDANGSALSNTGPGGPTGYGKEDRGRLASESLPNNDATTRPGGVPGSFDIALNIQRSYAMVNREYWTKNIPDISGDLSPEDQVLASQMVEKLNTLSVNLNSRDEFTTALEKYGFQV